MGTVIALPLWSPPEDALPLKRGERDNNPGCIEFDPHTDWVGLLGIEILPKAERQKYTPRFCRFDTPEHGIRAIAKCLHTYVERDLPAEHKPVTMRNIVERWDEDAGDDVEAYIAAVCEELGCKPDDVHRPDPSDYADWTRAIIHHEQGRVIYPDVMIADAVGMALAA